LGIFEMIYGTDMERQEFERVNKTGLERELFKRRMNRRLDRIANMSLLTYLRLAAAA